MKTIKDLETETFIAQLFRPLLHKYVDWYDIICLAKGDRIEVNLAEGKWDDGLYYLERRGATLYFYRAGCFNKIVVANETGVYSYTPKQFNQGSVSGVAVKTQKYLRFFAMN